MNQFKLKYINYITEPIEVTKGNYIIGEYFDIKEKIYYELHYCNQEYYTDALLIDDLWHIPKLKCTSNIYKEVLYFIEDGITIKSEFTLDSAFTDWGYFSRIHKSFKPICKRKRVQGYLNSLDLKKSNNEKRKTKPKISIITTVYNNAKILEQTIQSIINQESNDYEYIVKDACSNDNFKEVIEKYSKYNIKVLISTDKGIYDGMEQGFRSASGEYLQILNSDDVFYNKDIVSKYVQAIEKTGKIAYCSNIIMHFPHKIILRKADLTKLKYRSCVNHTSLVLRRNIFYALGGFNPSLKIAADGDLTIKMYKNGMDIEELDFVCVHFRATGASNNNYTLDILKENLICRYNYSWYNIPGYCYTLIQFFKIKIIQLIKK